MSGLLFICKLSIHRRWFIFMLSELPSLLSSTLVSTQVSQWPTWVFNNTISSSRKHAHTLIFLWRKEVDWTIQTRVYTKLCELPARNGNSNYANMSLVQLLYIRPPKLPTPSPLSTTDHKPPPNSPTQPQPQPDPPDSIAQNIVSLFLSFSNVHLLMIMNLIITI